MRLASLPEGARIAHFWSLPQGRRAVAAYVALALFALAVGVALTRIGPFNIPTASLIVPTYRQITFTGDASQGSVSPDGQSIAYVTGELGGPLDDSDSLFVQGVEGGQALEVYRGNIESPAMWSPDGTSLLVATRAPGVGVSLMLVPRLGGSPRVLGESFPEVTWSPDGLQVAGTRNNPPAVHILESTTGSTRVLELTGDIARAGEVDWSPRGDRIAVVTRAGGGFSLWSVAVEDGRQFRILEDEAGIFYPRWSPSGDSLYYLRNQNELWKIDVTAAGEAAGSSRLLLENAQARSRLTISADGTRLVYSRQNDEIDLWIVAGEEVDGRLEATTRQLTSGTADDSLPRLSPDGQDVVFSRAAGDNYNIFVMPTAGGRARQVTFLSGEARARGAVWSPDGQEIAFGATTAWRDEPVRVWKVSADGGAPEEFPLSQSTPGSLEWAPGTRILYRRAENPSYSAIDVDTGEETPLFADDSVGFLNQPRYSPDGSQVALFRRSPDRGIWLASADGELEGLIDGQPEVDSVSRFPIGWTADGTWVYAWGEWNGSLQIVRLPVGGGGPEPVLELPWNLSQVESCDTSDGRQFVCGVLEVQSDVWLVENFDPEAP